jgi:RecA-family ATPase
MQKFLLKEGLNIVNNITTSNNPKFFKESLNKFDMIKEPPKISESLRGLPVGECALLCAPGGIGKSYFVLNLILACCGLTENHLVDKTMKVLYVSLEDALSEINRRLYAYKVALDLTSEKLENTELDFKIIENKSADRLLVKGVKQEDNKFWQELNGIIKEGGYELVIIDTLIKTYSGYEENNNVDMSVLLSHFGTMANNNDCSILLLHHTNKGALNQNADINQSISRGASSLVDNSRFVLSLSLSKLENNVICKSIKTNFSAPTCQEYYRGYKGALIMEGSEEEVENVA